MSEGYQAAGRHPTTRKKNHAVAAASATQSMTITAAATRFTGRLVIVSARARASANDRCRDHPAGGRDRKGNQKQFIGVADNRDKVGDEVDRAEDVGDDAGDEDPRVPGHARVTVGAVERVDLPLEQSSALPPNFKAHDGMVAGVRSRQRPKGPRRGSPVRPDTDTKRQGHPRGPARLSEVGSAAYSTMNG